MSATPESLSTNPHAATTQKNGLGELFDSMNKHNSAPSASEEDGDGTEADMTDESEQQQRRKRKGEVEDLFAKLKKSRTAKADKQVSTQCSTMHVQNLLQTNCSRGVRRQQRKSPG